MEYRVHTDKQETETWVNYFARRRSEGIAETVLIVLDERGIAVSDEQRVHLLSCRDDARLQDWVCRAVHVASADELFGDD